MTKTMQELRWDKQAEKFNKMVKLDNGNGIDKVINFFQTHNILNKDSNIIDVGCGNGRYSIKFSKESKQVTGVDISSEMLKFAKKNSDGINNINFKKLDWNNFDIESSTLKYNFDLAFVSMVPIINDIESLEKFNKLSKGYCSVNRFIKRVNSINEILNNNLKRTKDPHNDRSYVKNLFNILWDKGYNANIYCYSTFDEYQIPLKEAIDYYGNNDNNKIKILKNMADNQDLVKYNISSEFSLIYWKTK